jgi:hypothetical protein
VILSIDDAVDHFVFSFAVRQEAISIALNEVHFAESVL